MDKIKLTKPQVNYCNGVIATFMNLKFNKEEGIWYPEPNGRKDITTHELKINQLSMGIDHFGEYNNKLQLLYFQCRWEWLMPALFQLNDEWDKHRPSNPFHNTKFWSNFKEGILNQDILISFTAVSDGINWLNDYIKRQK